MPFVVCSRRTKLSRTRFSLAIIFPKLIASLDFLLILGGQQQYKLHYKAKQFQAALYGFKWAVPLKLIFIEHVP